METGSEQVREGVRLGCEARQSLDDIVDASGRGAGMAERIALAAKEEANTARQMTASMVCISEVTRETERSTGQVHISSEELSRIAGELSRMASWFRVEGGGSPGPRRFTT